MWKPIGKVIADFELMIKETSWGDGRWARNWQGRQRLESHDLKDSMDSQVSELKDQIKELKSRSEEDLSYYRSQLDKAAAKMVSK